MADAARVLAVWLTPVTWLMLPALIVSGGPDGLWIGLVLALAPLLALHIAAWSAAAGPRRPESVFHTAVLLLAVGLLIWANLRLAGDLVLTLGGPRWHGVVVAAAGGLILAAWRGAHRVSAPLVLVALTGIGLPFLVLAWTASVGPVRAWEVVASRPAFQFSSESPWVTSGRDLASLRARAPIFLDEEHRITAAAGGTVRVLTQDGGRAIEREWRLAAGQSIVLRPGDSLAPGSDARIRFETDRRIPGAPPSGVAWAAGGRRRGWLPRFGLGITLVGGALALLANGVDRVPRMTVAVAGAGLVVALAWAEGWAVYGALLAPEVFLGGVTIAGVAEVPALALAPSALGLRLQGLLLVGLLAAFLASTVALRARPGGGGAAAREEIGSDLGLWAGVFVGAAAASLWPVDPWTLTRWALGAAASAVAPATLLPPPRSRAATVAGVTGLALFALLSVGGRVLGPSGGLLAAALDSPAVVAAPVALGLLWLARRVSAG